MQRRQGTSKSRSVARAAGAECQGGHTTASNEVGGRLPKQGRGRAPRHSPIPPSKYIHTYWRYRNTETQKQKYRYRIPKYRNTGWTLDLCIQP